MSKIKFENLDLEYLHDLDLERSILSSILANNDILGEIFDLINSKDFYSIKHGEIYKAMVECLNSDTPIATAFIKNKLGTSFDESIFVDILGTSPIVDVEKYAKELKEKSIKRALISVAQTIPSKVNEDKSGREMVDELSQSFYALVDQSKSGGIRDSADIINSLIEHIKKQATLDEKGLVGLNSGFKGLNEKTNGFKDGDLIIVAARPGMGKTTLCLNFINHVLKEDKGVVFFSLEMPAEQIMMRMLSSITSIPLQGLISGKMDDSEYEKLNDACQEMSEKKLFVYDDGYVNIHQIRTQLRKLKSAHPEISLCVVDYIGLMMSTSSFSERHLQIAEISRGLKLLARELDMPIIALSQLNRSLESRANKRPMLSDLRESGSIEQDADVILFVYREEVYLEQEEKEKEQRAKAEGREYKSNFTKNKIEEKAEIIIGKNRNGEPGTVEVVFQSKYTRFVDAVSMPLQTTEFSG